MRLLAGPAIASPTPAHRGNLRAEVMAKAPHMQKAALRTSTGSGFDLDLDDGRDELDSEFARRGAA
jgi:methyl-accepting chemotaxis protein